MGKKDFFTRLLAVFGTLVLWLVLLSPVLFSGLFYLRSNQLHFDYLMPAEFFPAALIGGLLLFWAALRAKSHSRAIAWGLLLAILTLWLGQGYAVISGLASGEIEAAGLPWMLVLASLALYVLGLLIAAWNGLKLLGVVYKK